IPPHQGHRRRADRPPGRGGQTGAIVAVATSAAGWLGGRRAGYVRAKRRDPARLDREDRMGDKLEGKLDQASGKAKEAAGRATDDESLEREGRGEQANGAGKEGVGKMKDAVRHAGR